MFKPLSIVGLVILLGGCASSPRATWCGTYGGCLEDCRLSRLQSVAALFAWAGLDVRKVHVLGSPTVGAYSWGTGDVYVTAGLLDVADDSEVSAALAHEMGHLVHEYRVLAPVGLAGVSGRAGADVESRADAVAVELLKRNQISTKALTGLLEKVAAYTPALRGEIQARIHLLSSAPR